MRALTRRWFAAAVFVSVACGPNVGIQDEPSNAAVEYATKVCAAISSCGCAIRFASDDQCEDDLTERFDDVVDRGASVDEGCFALTLDDEKLTECPNLSAMTDSCTALKGSREEGEECIGHPEVLGLAVNECADGLHCFDDVCAATDPVQFDAEGDACDPAVQRRCVSSSTVDLYCAPDSTCKEAISEGGACDSAFACNSDVFDGARGLYCKGFGQKNGVCSFQSLIGEPCDALDAMACGVNGEGELEGLEGWCDPATETCVADGPAVCAAADYPLAWPW